MIKILFTTNFNNVINVTSDRDFSQENVPEKMSAQANYGISSSVQADVALQHSLVALLLLTAGIATRR